MRKDTCRQSRTHMQAVSDAFLFINPGHNQLIILKFEKFLRESEGGNPIGKALVYINYVFMHFSLGLFRVFTALLCRALLVSFPDPKMSAVTWGHMMLSCDVIWHGKVKLHCSTDMKIWKLCFSTWPLTLIIILIPRYCQGQPLHHIMGVKQFSLERADRHTHIDLTHFILWLFMQSERGHGCIE